MSAYSAAVLANSPLLYARLDTTVGTEADLGSGGHTLTYGSVVTRGVASLLPGDPDLAVSIGTDVSNSVVTSPNAADLNFTAGPFTIEAWINHTASSGVYGIVGQSDGSHGWSARIRDTNQAALLLGGVGEYTGAQQVFSAGAVHHIVYVFKNGGNFDLYRNGAFVETVTTAASPLTEVSASIRIGNTSAGDFFNGVIDEVAVYGTALSASAILAHYNAATAIAGPPVRPIMAWP